MQSRLPDRGPQSMGLPLILALWLGGLAGGCGRADPAGDLQGQWVVDVDALLSTPDLRWLSEKVRDRMIEMERRIRSQMSFELTGERVSVHILGQTTPYSYEIRRADADHITLGVIRRGKIEAWRFTFRPHGVVLTMGERPEVPPLPLVRVSERLRGQWVADLDALAATPVFRKLSPRRQRAARALARQTRVVFTHDQLTLWDSDHRLQAHYTLLGMRGRTVALRAVSSEKTIEMEVLLNPPNIVLIRDDGPYPLRRKESP